MQGRPTTPKDYDVFLDLPNKYKENVDGHAFLQSTERIDTTDEKG